MKIVNLTQHAATTEQVEQGLVEVREDRLDFKASLLTFEDLPTQAEILDRADHLTVIARASGCNRAMIGGAPYLMAPLEMLLKEAGIQPVYAFSVRESVEEKQIDGSVIKRNVFKHRGFIE